MLNCICVSNAYHGTGRWHYPSSEVPGKCVTLSRRRLRTVAKVEEITRNKDVCFLIEIQLTPVITIHVGPATVCI